MTDEDGHGTHCAGTIGAVGNNALGVAGVNWSGVRMLSCKFLGTDGVGYIAGSIKCLDYCIAHGGESRGPQCGAGGELLPAPAPPPASGVLTRPPAPPLAHARSHDQQQ